MSHDQQTLERFVTLKKLFSGGNTLIGKDWLALRTLDLDEWRRALRRARLPVIFLAWTMDLL